MMDSVVADYFKLLSRLGKFKAKNYTSPQAIACIGRTWPHGKYV